MGVGAPKSELGRRLLTAFIGIVVIVSIFVWGGRPGIDLFTFVVSLGMVLEYATITFSLEDRAEKKVVLASVATVTLLGNFLTYGEELAWASGGFLALSIWFLLSAGRFRAEDEKSLSRHFRELCYSFFGLFYLVFLPLFFPKIRMTEGGVHWIMIFLFVVWGGDSGAYFAGRYFGKRKLFPRISPKKTVEGAVGGLITGFVAALLYRAAFFPVLSVGELIVISLMVGLIAPLGDLCESFLKRAFDKKDSGSFLPGHGGFLDRFDGVVFGLPVMYACMRLFS